jgi:hypothetical protein
MLSTTNGIVVPAIVAVMMLLQRASRWLVVAHALLAVAGVVGYLALVPGSRESTAEGTLDAGPRLLPAAAYFFALFGSFLTYASVPLGMFVGAGLAAAGLVWSTSVLRGWSQAPRAERFATGVMAFAGASALMAAVGRASHFGIEYAAQSRYGTYAMAYWAGLLMLLLSSAERTALTRLHVIVGPAAQWLAVPLCLSLLLVQVVSGVVWTAKADNIRAAGLAVASGVEDDQWIRTLHGEVKVIYRARALAVASGDRAIASPDLGRLINASVSAAECDGSLSIVRAPEGPALRIQGALRTGARSGWILDADGIVVGVMGRAPVVDQPDPTGADVFGALIHAIRDGSLLSSTRWIGFAPASARSPLAFVAVEAGRMICRKAL